MVSKSVVEKGIEDLIELCELMRGKRGSPSNDYLDAKIAGLQEALEFVRKLPNVQPLLP